MGHIKRLDDFTEQERRELSASFKLIPMSLENGCFGENGFRYSDEVIEGIGNSVIFMPLEHMSAFCSKETQVWVEVTRHGENDIYLDRFKKAHVSYNLSYHYDDIVDTRFIGNTAYQALYDRDQTVKQTSLSMLEFIYKKEAKRKNRFRSKFKLLSLTIILLFILFSLSCRYQNQIFSAVSGVLLFVDAIALIRLKEFQKTKTK